MNLFFAVFTFVLFPLSSFATLDSPSCLQARDTQEKLLQKVYRNSNALGEFRFEGKPILHFQTKKTLSLSSSKFLIASLSKPITAILIHKASDEGKLDLDQTLDHFFPNRFSKISIRNLLIHASGLVDFVNATPRGFPSLSKTQNHETMIAKIPNFLLFEPNQKVSYSNTNFFLASKILEKVYEKSFQEILKEKLVEPLQLGVLQAEYGKPKNTFGSTSIALSNLQGAGNLSSNIEDLFSILRALDPESGFLSKTSLERLYQIDETCGNGDRSRDEITRCHRSTMGLRIRENQILDQYTPFFHEGKLKKVSALAGKLPVLKTDYVVLSDKNSINGEMLAKQIFEDLLVAKCFEEN